MACGTLNLEHTAWTESSSGHCALDLLWMSGWACDFLSARLRLEHHEIRFLQFNRRLSKGERWLWTSESGTYANARWICAVPSGELNRSATLFEPRLRSSNFGLHRIDINRQNKAQCGTQCRHFLHMTLIINLDSFLFLRYRNYYDAKRNILQWIARYTRHLSTFVSCRGILEPKLYNHEFGHV